MQKIKLFIVFVFLSELVCSQTMQPGIAYTWIPNLCISGCKISNHFIMPTGRISIDIGIDFIIGRGNPNLDYSEKMSYNLGLANYHDFYAYGIYYGGQSGGYQYNTKPITTSTTQINASCGISRSINIGSSDFTIALGGYLSRTSSHFLIGPFNDADVDFYLVTNDGNYTPVLLVDSTKWDVMFPVNLRYMNIGAYVGAEYLLMQEKRVPIGIELKYFAGLKGKNLATLGINFHLPCAKSGSSE